MRTWAGAAAAALLVSCTGGGGAGDRATAPLPSSAPTTAAATSPTTVEGSGTTTPAAPATGDPPGSVTLLVRGFSLPSGAGLRVLVRASSPRLTVRRQGSAATLFVCPVTDATTAVDPGDCAELGTGRDVELGGTRGVEIAAGRGGAMLEELSLTYVPADRSMTVVTPARQASSCAPAVCQATFSLTPARPGAFHLDGRPGGGRPQLTLRSESAGGGSRVLATVEGGGALSVTGTLDAGAEAVLLYREQVDGAVAALTMEISWP